MLGDELVKKDSTWEKLPRRPRIIVKENEKGIGGLQEPGLDLLLFVMIKHMTEAALAEKLIHESHFNILLLRCTLRWHYNYNVIFQLLIEQPL